jgi:hypothetical protein
MEDTSQIAKSISSIVQSSRANGVLGSDLTILVRQRHPEFRPAFHGCRNLREFVKRFVPSVFESGRRGLDVLYSTVSTQVTTSLQSHSQSAASQSPNAESSHPDAEHPVAAARDLEVDAVVWKTYVSPNSPFRLYVNPRSCVARVIETSDPDLAQPWIFIPPCSATKHLEIARRFVDGLPTGEARNRLEDALQKEVWWLPFFSLARTFDLGRNWAAFRSRHLTAELRGTLEALGVRLPPRGRLRLEGAAVTAAPLADGQRKATLLRRLAQRAVANMPESQLRLLRLPLGYVVDQLDEER